MASCGGINITNLTQDGTDECYRLEGTDEIIEKEPICDSSKPSLWSITNKHNEGTCNYRVDVTNSETGESQSSVYPFNESGYVYDVNGKYVMASCGGEEIVNLTQNGTDECYKLDGTNEVIKKEQTCGDLKSSQWKITDIGNETVCRSNRLCCINNCNRSF